MDFKLLNNEFNNQIKQIDETEIVKEKFSYFIQQLLIEKQWSQERLGEAIGLSQNIISKWIKQKVYPENLITKNFRSLAEVAGWTMDDLYNFIYSVDSDLPNYDQVKNESLELPVIQMISLSRELNDFAYQKLSRVSGKEFSKIIIRYLEDSNLDMLSAAKFFRIMPQSRFQELVDGALPTKTEIMRLASAHVLTKQSGEKYDFIELYNQAYGFQEKL